MKEVKRPNKPILSFYAVTLLIIILLTRSYCPRSSNRRLWQLPEDAGRENGKHRSG